MNVRGYLAIAVAAGALLVGGAFYASHAAHERAVARGARMAQMLGCVSCHDANLNGHLVEDDPERALIWSTNLSRSLSGWSDSDIERAVRQGKRPDGTDILVMPVASFNPLPSGDMDDLIAWLRSRRARQRLRRNIWPRIWRARRSISGRAMRVAGCWRAHCAATVTHPA